jgi:hypothetical protein
MFQFWHVLPQGQNSLSLFLWENMRNFGILYEKGSQTFNKFFKIEKHKALGNTNKAVKDLYSTLSFNFVLISKD